jgi:hypothetical protein
MVGSLVVGLIAQLILAALVKGAPLAAIPIVLLGAASTFRRPHDQPVVAA